jgi:6-phosphofructokinase 1
MKKIGLITSGGDAPGMNAVIRAIVKRSLKEGVVPFGIVQGFQGMIENKGAELSSHDVSDIIYRGGTILRTARSAQFKTEEGINLAADFLIEQAVEGLIVIGGDGTFKGAQELSILSKIPVVGVPATIDNDINETDYTIGFDTALNTIIEAVDKIRDTANSHHRVFFVEVMGRDTGVLALHGAIACGASSVLVPEEKTDINKLVNRIKASKENESTIIIVAEGDDAGNSLAIMKSVEPLLPGYEIRHTVLGHIQRGGAPSAKDRIIGTRMGDMAIEILLNRASNSMIGYTYDTFNVSPLSQAVSKNSLPNLEMLRLVENLGN